MNGKGKYVYASTDGNGAVSSMAQTIFEGTWVEDKRHGPGRFFFPTGDCLEINYDKGVLAQTCKYYYVSGAVYEGGWVNMRKNGKGKYTFSNGGRALALDGFCQ